MRLPDFNTALWTLVTIALVCVVAREVIEFVRGRKRATIPAEPTTTADLERELCRLRIRRWIGVTMGGGLIVSNGHSLILELLGVLVSLIGACGTVWCFANLPLAKRPPTT